MTPDLQLRTLYVLDDFGRLVAVREPGSPRPPLLVLIRGRDTTAWAIRSDVDEATASGLAMPLGAEPSGDDLAADPVHAERYPAHSGESKRVRRSRSRTDSRRPAQFSSKMHPRSAPRTSPGSTVNSVSANRWPSSSNTVRS